MIRDGCQPCRLARRARANGESAEERAASDPSVDDGRVSQSRTGACRFASFATLGHVCGWGVARPVGGGGPGILSAIASQALARRCRRPPLCRKCRKSDDVPRARSRRGHSGFKNARRCGLCQCWGPRAARSTADVTVSTWAPVLLAMSSAGRPDAGPDRRNLKLEATDGPRACIGGRVRRSHPSLRINLQPCWRCLCMTAAGRGSPSRRTGAVCGRNTSTVQRLPRGSNRQARPRGCGHRVYWKDE
jgi:hypothetical protein